MIRTLFTPQNYSKSIKFNQKSIYRLAIPRSSEFAIRWCRVWGFAIPFNGCGFHGNKSFFISKYSSFFSEKQGKMCVSHGKCWYSRLPHCKFGRTGVQNFAEFFVSLQKASTPKCSKRIFNPMRIKMIPPNTSAFFLNFVPKTLPIFTPTTEKTNVVSPMSATDDHNST